MTLTLESTLAEIERIAQLSDASCEEDMQRLLDLVPTAVTIARAHLEAQNGDTGRQEAAAEISRLRADLDEAVGLLTKMQAWFSKATNGEEGCDYLNGEGRWTLENPVSGWTDGGAISGEIRAFLSRHEKEKGDG